MSSNEDDSKKVENIGEVEKTVPDLNLPPVVPISTMFSNNPSMSQGNSNKLLASKTIPPLVHKNKLLAPPYKSLMMPQPLLASPNPQIQYPIVINNDLTPAQNVTGPTRPPARDVTRDKRALSESTVEKTVVPTKEDTSSKKPKRRRRTFSCETCRTLKIRCDFQPFIGKCHKCLVASLECSLTKERAWEITEAISLNSQTVEQTSIRNNTNIVERMESLEDKMVSVDQKLNYLISLFQGNDDAATSKMQTNSPVSRGGFNNGATAVNSKGKDAPSNVFSRSGSPDSDYSLSRVYTSHGVITKDPPFKLIDDIDKKLFSTKANTTKDALAKSQRPFVVARSAFMEFFNKYEQMCYDLSQKFLIKAHFWIIPGGVKTINRAYVENHAFITSVFTLIAMGFDENNKYEKEQEELYPIVERLLTNTLTMFDKLSDHDVEAILYCCMFSISRKSKRYRQLKFNSLILCNFALNSIVTIINFHKIKGNVADEHFSALDLFHLRILNSLTAIKLEYSIGYGNFTLQDNQLAEFNNLTAKYPQANFGDEIKLSEINLSDIVNGIFLNLDEYVVHSIKSFEAKETKLLKFKELQYWLKNWHELSSKDGGGVLLFTFDFYHIVICRSFLREYCDIKTFETHTNFFKVCLKTVSEFCFSLLNGFLKLPSSLIKGAPTITLHHAVYSCLTLCDYLHCFEANERQKVLNLCTKIYWHLNTIGEQLNEATQNVGIIIKILIDSSKKKMMQNPETLDTDQLFERIQKGSQHFNLGKKTVEKYHSHLNKSSTHASIDDENSQLDESSSSLRREHIKKSDNLFASPGSDTTPGSTTTTSNGFNPQSLNLPDVDQFQSFEDFFQDFFYNLKPNSQNMFSGID